MPEVNDIFLADERFVADHADGALRSNRVITIVGETRIGAGTFVKFCVGKRDVATDPPMPQEVWHATHEDIARLLFLGPPTLHPAPEEVAEIIMSDDIAQNPPVTRGLLNVLARIYDAEDEEAHDIPHQRISAETRERFLQELEEAVISAPEQASLSDPYPPICSPKRTRKRGGRRERMRQERKRLAQLSPPH